MKELNAVKFKDVKSFNKNKTKANVKRYIEHKRVIVFEDSVKITPDRAKVSHVFKVDDIDRIPSNEAIICLQDYKKGLEEIKKQGLKIKTIHSKLGMVVIDLPEHTPYNEVHKLIGKSRSIKTVEQDYFVAHKLDAVDFVYNDIWQLPALRAQEAWALIPPGTDNYVAVFDIACQTTHPDLVGQLFDNYNHWTNTPNVEPTFPTDSAISHGTPCSGIICANPTNGIDTIGLAGPRTKVTFQGIGAPAGGGSFFTSNAVQVAAVEYVMANPLCAAISMSYGCGFCSCTTISPTDIRQTAFERARIYGRGGDFSTNTPGLGILSFASSGNDGTLNCGTLPANYPIVVSVGATNIDGTRASFSNYGPKIDFAAPGVRVPSTDITGSGGYNLTLNGILYPNSDTCTPNGTSFSCPLAAGVAGAIAAANPGLTADQILDIMKLTCNQVGPYNYNYDISTPGKSVELGYGQVDLYAAVSLATSGTVPPGPVVLPDLRVVINSPTIIDQGADMTINYTLSLNIVAQTDITFDVKIFYSLDGTYDPTDPEIITKPETIVQGTFFTQGSYTFTVPNTLSGDVWFGVFADSTNVIDPEPELNNVGIRKTFVQGTVVPVGLNLAVEIDSLTIDSVTGIANVRYRFTNTGAVTVTNFKIRKGFDGLENYEYLLYRTIESEDRLEFDIPWTNIPGPNDLFTTLYRIEILEVNGVADDDPADNVAVALPDIALPNVINV